MVHRSCWAIRREALVHTSAWIYVLNDIHFKPIDIGTMALGAKLTLARRLPKRLHENCRYVHTKVILLPVSRANETSLVFPQEEACIEAPLEHAGTLLFRINGVQWACQIEIYRAETYTGVPTEWVAFSGQILTGVVSHVCVEPKRCDHCGSELTTLRIISTYYRFPTTNYGSRTTFGCHFYLRNVTSSLAQISSSRVKLLSCRNGGSEQKLRDRI